MERVADAVQAVVVDVSAAPVKEVPGALGLPDVVGVPVVNATAAAPDNNSL